MTEFIFKLATETKAGQVYLVQWHGRPVVELVEKVYLQGYTIPKGFRTDFASIPLWAAWLIPVFGVSCRAAILHDWLCFMSVKRSVRSREFLAQMLQDGVPKWQAYVQFWVVKFFPGPERIEGELFARFPST